MNKFITMSLILVLALASVGCQTLRERTSILPKGQDEWMQADLDGREVQVRTLVKVEF